MQVETVSKKDAMQFPLIGSCVLFGLYIVVKFVKKEYLDMLISAYFLFLGAFGLFGSIQQPVTELLGCTELKRYPVCINWQFWKRKEDAGVPSLLLARTLLTASRSSDTASCAKLQLRPVAQSQSASASACSTLSSSSDVAASPQHMQ